MEENKKIDFEASLKQLEEIVNKIENQTLPLDDVHNPLDVSSPLGDLIMKYKLQNTKHIRAVCFV